MTKFEEIKRLQEEIKSKRTELEVLERKLKKSDNFYIILSDGSIGEQPINIFAWAGNVEYYYQGNLFDSKEDAELEAKRRKLLTRFREFRDECNDGWKPDWNDNNSKKWVIVKNEERIYAMWTVGLNTFSYFGCFKNQFDTERAIELFGDEIKKLFTDCECD